MTFIVITKKKHRTFLCYNFNQNEVACGNDLLEPQLSFGKSLSINGTKIQLLLALFPITKVKIISYLSFSSITIISYYKFPKHCLSQILIRYDVSNSKLHTVIPPFIHWQVHSRINFHQFQTPKTSLIETFTQNYGYQEHFLSNTRNSRQVVHNSSPPPDLYYRRHCLALLHIIYYNIYIQHIRRICNLVAKFLAVRRWHAPTIYVPDYFCFTG